MKRLPPSRPEGQALRTGDQVRVQVSVSVPGYVTVINVGPTGDGLHTADEWVDLESVDQCADMFVRMCRAFCR